MLLSGKYKGKYLGKTICGFVHGFEYELELSNNGMTYCVKAYKDITMDTDVKLSLAYTSEENVLKTWQLERTSY